MKYCTPQKYYIFRLKDSTLQPRGIKESQQYQSEAQCRHFEVHPIPIIQTPKLLVYPLRREEITNNKRWTRLMLVLVHKYHAQRHLHVVIITSDREGEAALNPLACRIGVGAFQRAAGEHCFLGVVEGNCTELLPVANQLVLDNNFVDGKFALQKEVSILSRAGKHSTLTSRRLSIGTSISCAISLLPRKISPVRRQQQAGIAILAKTRSYSIKLRSNHISTRISSMSVRLCMRSRNLGRNLSSCRRIFCRDSCCIFFSMYWLSLA